MSQNTTVVLDGTGTQVLTSINSALDTLNTLHAGAAAPPDAECHVNMLWADTSVNPALLKACTVVGAPSTFVTLGKLTTNFGLVPLTGDSTIDGNLTLAAGKKLTLTSEAVEFASAAPASAATLAVTGGNLLQPTGITTITALGTAQAGAMRQIRFTTALQLTNSATFILFGKNIITEAGDSALFFSLDGGTWYLHSYQRGDGSIDMDGAQLNEAQGANIAAAATTNLATMTGNYAIVTNTAGATVITALGTAQAGARRSVTFSITGGSVSITHNATSLILPGGENMSITDGDSALFMSLGGGNWRMLHYQKNSLSATVWSVVNKNTSYTVTTADSGKFFTSTATTPNTFSLPTAASAGAGFICGFRNINTNSAKMSIAANGSEKVEGVSVLDGGVGTSYALICDGSAWYRMDTGVASAAPPTYTNAQVFAVSGSFTVPAGAFYIRVTLWGGGGGGGGSSGTNASSACSGGAGGGGGSGSFATGVYSVVPAQVYTVTVGNAGATGAAGAVSGNGGTGGTGGTTSFAALLSCPGGSGGVGGIYNSSAAGTAGAGGAAAGMPTGSGGSMMGGAAGGNGYNYLGTTSYGGGGASASGVSGGAINGENANTVVNYTGAGAIGSGGAAGGARIVNGGAGNAGGAVAGATRESGGGGGGALGGTGTAFVGGSAGSPGSGGGGAAGSKNLASASAGAVGGAGGAGKCIVEW